MGTRMKTLKIKNRHINRFVALMFAAVMVFTLVFTSIPFDNIAYAAGDDDEGGVSNLSLYNRSSELAREFGTSLAPGTEQDFTKMISNANAGTAGGLLGYADIMSDDNAVVGWLTSSFTTASVQLTYDQLENITGSKEDNPFYAYAGYGEALNAMGLSKTVRGNSGKMGRTAATGIITFLYLVSLAISMLFGLAMKVIVMLNPFKLFMGIFGNVADLELGLLSAAAAQVQLIYEAIQDIALYVLLPMFLVITIFTVLVFAKGQALKRFSRYALRVFMIFAGIPLIGATYTGIVEDLEESISTGSMVSEYLVYSSYVDFENWVKETRLGAPREGYTSGSESIRHPRFVADGSDSIDKMHNPSRSFILGLNAKQAGNAKAYDIYTQFNEGGLAGALGSQSELEYKDAADIKVGQSGLYAKQTALDLLLRHMANDTYSSSHYDGEVTGQVQKLLDGTIIDDDGNADNSELTANDTEILRMFVLTASKNRTWQKSTDLKIKPHPDDPGDNTVDWWKKPVKFHASAHLLNPEEISANAFDFSHYPAHIYNNGDLELISFGDGDDDAGSGHVFRAYSLEDGAVDGGVPLSSDGTITGGLSPLAMYNFLNTTFSDSGLTIWSSDKSSSDQTRDAYAAVVHGGTGVTGFLRWLETATLMTSMNLLTIVFSVMMIQVAIAGIPRILFSVFGTALGSIASTTKLLISTGVLLLQFIGMMFMYYLSENIIVGMMIQIDKFVGSTVDEYDTASIMLFNGSIGGPLDSITLVSGNVVIEVFKSIMMIIVVVATTFFMMKNISTMKNLLEEMVTDGLQRLMSGLDVGTGGKGHGMDAGNLSGGRVGQDGKLTDDAKKMGAPQSLLAANDLAGKKEAAALANGASLEDVYGEGADAKGISGVLNRAKGKAKNRFSKDGLAGDGKSSIMGRMGKAQAADYAKKALTGHSGNLDRAVDAEAQKIQNQSRASTFGLDDRDSKKELPTDGNLMTGENGEVLDKNGEVFRDENGEALYADDYGNLVDSDGELASIGADGVMHNVHDEPVPVHEAAHKLDNMRSDDNERALMEQRQDETHHGLGKNGEPLDKNGKPLQTRSGKQVSLDNQGRLVDEDGELLSAKDLKGKVDAKAFDSKVDEDGQQYLQHKGDDALTPSARINGKAPAMKAGPDKSLTSLADEANRADRQAKQARNKVNKLKANGARPFAIQQAENQAKRLEGRAKDAQGEYDKQVASGHGRTNERVRSAHVENAKRSVNQAEQKHASATQKVEAEQQKLKQLQQANEPVHEQRAAVAQAQEAHKTATGQLDTAKTALATANAEQQKAFANQTANPSKANKQAYDKAVANTQQAKATYQQSNQAVSQTKQQVATSQATLSNLESSNQEMIQAEQAQEKVVQQAQTQAQTAQKNVKQARTSAAYTRKAHVAGRSYGEVEKAHQKQTKVNGQYQQAYQAYETAQASGNTAQINRARANMNNVANTLTHANDEVARVSQQPQGTMAQIDSAQSEVKRAEHQVQNTTGRKQQRAQRQLRQSQRRLDRLQEPMNWSGGSAAHAQALTNSQGNVAQMRNTMRTQGVVSYSDYAENIQTEQDNIKKSRVQLRRTEAALAQSIPEPARKKVEQRRDNLQNKIQQSSANISDLQSNAAGMLQTQGFRTSISSRPIQSHGGAVITQLSNLNGMQSMHNSLTHRQENGSLDDAGKAQLQKLEARMAHSRSELIGLGIQEEYLSDSKSIQTSLTDVRTSWLDYMNGKG